MLVQRAGVRSVEQTGLDPGQPELRFVCHQEDAGRKHEFHATPPRHPAIDCGKDRLGAHLKTPETAMHPLGEPGAMLKTAPTVDVSNGYSSGVDGRAGLECAGRLVLRCDALDQSGHRRQVADGCDALSGAPQVFPEPGAGVIQ